MQYFSTLPKIIYADANKNVKLYTNLLARADVISSLTNNSVLFYQYDIQDQDTPETIAYKYYGDVYRYWMIFYCNQIIDPQWDWPLNNQQFNDFIFNKYASQAAAYYYNIDHTTTVNNITQSQVLSYTTSQVQSYTKTITQFDQNTGTTTENVISIDLNTYNNTLETTNTYTLPTGNVTISVTKQIISYYTYEVNTNEAKRSIKLINKSYADQLESELKSLMSS